MNKIDRSFWKIPGLGSEDIGNQVQTFIIKKIQNAELLPGQLIPSHRRLADLNDLNPSTVKKAYEALVAKNQLTAFHGSGTYVAANDNDTDFKYHTGGFVNEAPVSFYSLTGIPDQVVNHDFQSMGIDRLSEYHYPRTMEKYIKIHTRRYKRIYQADQIRDAISPGYVNAIRGYFNTHYNFKMNEGCMTVIMDRKNALHSIFSMLLKPGDAIVNTAAGDFLLNVELKTTSATIYELNTSSPDFLNLLKTLLSTTTIKVLYVNSQCSYPDSNHLSPKTSLELLALAKAYHFYIVEENDFHEFWYNAKTRFLPLASYEHDGHVIHTAPLSQSSVYMYNTRIIASNEVFITALRTGAAEPVPSKDVIVELAITDLIRNGDLYRHVVNVRRAKKQHRDDLYWQLDNYLGNYMKIDKPASGLCFWLAFPPEVDVDKAMAFLKEHHVEIPYNPFSPLIKGQVFYMRSAFGTFNIDEAQTGAKLLKQMFDELGIPKLG